MLKRICLKFGPTPGSPPVQFTPAAMNVIVGPNNSGKSLTLQELQYSLFGANNNWDNNEWRVLADIEPALPPHGELLDQVKEAIKADLACLRPEYRSHAAAFRALAMLFGTVAMEPGFLHQSNNWLSILNDMKKKAETLVGLKRLRASPPILSASILEEQVQSGWVALSEWLPAEARSTMELILSVNERNDESLIAEGFVDLRGHYALFKKQSVLLNGSARLGLANSESCGTLRKAPSGTIMRLWHTRRNLEHLRALVHDAFGLYLCIDLLDLGHARLVLSKQPPPPGIEDSLDAEARKFIGAARPLHDFSDGVRTYIGLHAELIAQDPRFIMIDEPEAFLHPPLARRLGFNLSGLAAERGSCIIAATHSPDFLMGCIESGVGVNIIRLGYRNAIPSAHLLPRDELEKMMVDPLLRSTGILGALFHQAAVVVEGDSDRTFYTEVNERLRLHEPADHPPVMRDCVFLNAQGKATVSRILEALRRLGVASCGIVDLDLLKDAGICTNLLRAAGAPPSVCASIGVTRANVQASITDLKALCKPNGLAHATSDERKGVEHFIREMVSHGIFLPEVGPVEGWLSELGVGADKKGWIPAIFQAMGPVNTGLKPGRGDVWQFLRRIGRYLEDLGGTLDQTSISAPSVASIQD